MANSVDIDRRTHLDLHCLLMLFVLVYRAERIKRHVVTQNNTSSKPEELKLKCHVGMVNSRRVWGLILLYGYSASFLFLKQCFNANKKTHKGTDIKEN